MIRKHHILHIFCVFVGLFLFYETAYSQTREIDSLLVEANKSVYDDPENGLEIGEYIFNHPNTTTENKIRALMVISNAYSSKRYYEKSLEIAKSALDYFSDSDDISLKITVLNKLASQYQQLKIYNTSLNYLDESLKLIHKQPEMPSFQRHIGYNYATRGFIYREQMSCEIALNYFNKSLYYYNGTLEEKLMNANMSILNYNKGNCFITLNEIDSARICFINAIDYAEITDAKSLIGFAHKGLSEVYTLEGNYQKSIQILQEGVTIASDVGDLVLNQGLYKNLSNNYLAIGDTENFSYYQNLYDEAYHKNKTSESNTINQSVQKTIHETDDKITSLISEKKRIKILLWVIVLFIFLAVFYEIYSSYKEFKALKSAQKNIRKNI